LIPVPIKKLQFQIKMTLNKTIFTPNYAWPPLPNSRQKGDSRRKETIRTRKNSYGTKEENKTRKTKNVIIKL